VSPLVVLPGIYVLSLGLPSLGFSLAAYAYVEAWMRSTYIVPVDYYAAVFVVLFYVGFRWYQGRRGGDVVSSSLARAAIGSPQRFGAAAASTNLPETNVLCWLSVLLLVCYYAGAVALGMFAADEVRGAGQWDPLGLANYVFIFGQGGLTVSTITAGILKLRDRRKRLWLVPALTFIAYGATGSRGIVLPFILFLAPSLLNAPARLKRRFLLIVAVCVISAALIPQVRPGSYGFSAFVGGLRSGVQDAGELSLLRGVSSLETTTITFAIADQAKPPGVIRQLWKLIVPLPSFIVPQDIRLTNIMYYLGESEGLTGAPFPALGELLFFLGWAGLLVALPVGAFSAWLFRKFNASLHQSGREGLLWCLIYLSCTLSTVMSVHDGLRTVTRYPIWAVMWYYGFTRFTDLVQRIKRLVRSLPEAGANTKLSPESATELR
jgi:hypothetical protein